MTGNETPSTQCQLHLDCQRRRFTVDLAERGDVLVRIRILAAKLVAWEADHGETLVLVLLIGRLKSLELWCESTLTCSVDNENDLAFQLAHIIRRLFKGWLLMRLVMRKRNLNCDHTLKS